MNQEIFTCNFLFFCNKNLCGIKFYSEYFFFSVHNYNLWMMLRAAQYKTFVFVFRDGGTIGNMKGEIFPGA